MTAKVTLLLKPADWLMGGFTMAGGSSTVSEAILLVTLPKLLLTINA